MKHASMNWCIQFDFNWHTICSVCTAKQVALGALDPRHPRPHLPRQAPVVHALAAPEDLGADHQAAARNFQLLHTVFRIRVALRILKQTHAMIVSHLCHAYLRASCQPVMRLHHAFSTQHRSCLECLPHDLLSLAVRVDFCVVKAA